MSTKFITVTLDPSLDRTITAHYLTLGYKNRATQVTRLYPAGHGVNTARALHALELPTNALILLGNDASGHAYRALIMEEGFPVTIVAHESYTRSYITVVDTGNNTETNLYEESPEVGPEATERVAHALRQLIAYEDVVIFSGNLPAGVADNTYGQLTEIAQKAGAIVAITHAGNALKGALAAKPEVVLLRQLDAETFFNRPVRVKEDVIDCGQKLRAMGAKEVLILGQDESTALLTTEDGYHVVSFGDAHDLGTRGGVGEALLAGFLAGRSSLRPLEEALEMGAAAALFAASQVGNEFASTDDIEAVSEEIEVTSDG